MSYIEKPMNFKIDWSKNLGLLELSGATNVIKALNEEESDDDDSNKTNDHLKCLSNMDDEDDHYQKPISSSNAYILANNVDDEMQAWYVQYLSDEKCFQILRNSKDAQLRDGSFLINREYLLELNILLNRCKLKRKFLSNGQAKVFKIKIITSFQSQLSTNSNDKTSNQFISYSLETNLNKTFSNLSSLVDYYKKNPIKANEHSLKLVQGINKSLLNQFEAWYKYDSSKRELEIDLWNSKVIGSFFIRKPSNSNQKDDNGYQQVFTLVCYCGDEAEVKLINKQICLTEEGMLSVSTREFSSLIELIYFYKQSPIYNDILLRDAPPKKLNSMPNELADLSSIKLKIQPNESKKEGQINLIDIILELTTDKSNKKYGIVTVYCRLDKIKANPLLEFTSTLEKCINFINKINAKQKLINNLITNSKSSTSKKSKESKSAKEKNEINADLSNLIAYCQARSFKETNFHSLSYFEICSFSDQRKYISGDWPSRLNTHHNRVLSRVYPAYHHINSSNYDPLLYWLSGFQLVALNYQTPDKAMQLNQAKFMNNGGTGYLLKPNCMRTLHDPLKTKDNDAFELEIQIIAGRHIPKLNNNISECFVEVELITNNESSIQKLKTEAISGNGLCPYWLDPSTKDKKLTFRSTAIFESSFLRFTVYDKDYLSRPIAQATYPLSILRTGYRSVQLKNSFSEIIDMCSLLVKIRISLGN